MKSRFWTALPLLALALAGCPKGVAYHKLPCETNAFVQAEDRITTSVEASNDKVVIDWNGGVVSRVSLVEDYEPGSGGRIVWTADCPNQKQMPDGTDISSPSWDYDVPNENCISGPVVVGEPVEGAQVSNGHLELLEQEVPLRVEIYRSHWIDQCWTVQANDVSGTVFTP